MWLHLQKFWISFAEVNVVMTLERHFGRPEGEQLALEWRLEQPCGAKLALERRLEQPWGAKLATLHLQKFWISFAEVNVVMTLE